MRTTKRTASEQAKRSGFAEKLDDWLTQNARAYKATRALLGPRNPNQLAETLTARGEPTSAGTVRGWLNRDWLPGAAPIAALEILMKCTWAYLYDPQIEWFPAVEDREAISRAYYFSASERDQISPALASALAAARQHESARQKARRS